MANKLNITDTILRDGHQSKAATRMPLSDMLPACEALDNIGFWSLEVWGGATFGGLILGKIMCKATHGKINPLIGSAGVSAVPMAARVSQIEGQKANPKNFLLMHAMGPNVAGVIGSAIAAGFLLSVFGG